MAKSNGRGYYRQTEIEWNEIDNEFNSFLFSDDAQSLQYGYDPARQILVIKKPVPYIRDNFIITLGL